MLRIKTILIVLFLMCPNSLFSIEKEQNINTKTAVVFNTLCAKCHEGQCSGRLSFDTGSEAVSSHIRRYSDDVNISQNEIRQFFTLINYMKKECKLLMPESKKYQISELNSFSIPSHMSYFIPLGILKKGEYTLVIKLKEGSCSQIEIMSTKFDSSLDVVLSPNIKKQSLKFSIDEKLNYYLRLRSSKPLYVEILEIKE